jgi:hypothetical protein
MLVVGSFATLGGPADLGRFLVGGHVLDTTDFDGRRCPSEQTALALWRVCRLRGGPLWDGVADHIVAWVAHRINAAAASGPVHDLWRQRETHVRFLADALLLLAAAGDPAARAARSQLDHYARTTAVGRWFAHDSLEVARAHSDLVLNTHAQSVAATLAQGDLDCDAAAALDRSLEVRRDRRGLLLGAALTSSTLVRQLRPRAAARLAERFDYRVRESVSRHLARTETLRLPLGYIGRDALVKVSPPYYLITNIYDLGVLAANGGSPTVRDAARRAWRWAAMSGALRAFVDDAHPMASLLPVICQQQGREDQAARVADRVVGAGGHPVPGWPDHCDQPWSSLRAGTA